MRFLKALLVFLLLSPAAAFAQDDAALYLREAAGSALLYRGHVAHSYPMAYNGTYFWIGPQFEQGEVLYNGTYYQGVPLNVDASRQDLLVKTVSGGAEKVLDRELVSWFRMGGHRFVNLQQAYGPQAPSGYWEVLYDGRAKVIRQVVRTLRRDMNGELQHEVGYDGGNYRSDVHQTFTRSIRYCYISEDGQVVPVRRRSQLLQFYKEQKRDISRHIGHLESSGKLDFERFCVETVKFAETL